MDCGIELFLETFPIQNLSIESGNADFGQFYTAQSLDFVHCRLGLDVFKQALDGYP